MSSLVYDPSIHSPMNVAVFLSGSGTNFEALYSEQKRLEASGNPKYGRIGLVFTDVPECRGFSSAQKFAIPTERIDAGVFNQELGVPKNLPVDSSARVAFDALSIFLMEKYGRPDLICLAGYERWLSPYFVNRYRGKILNVHPGDSIKYSGLQVTPVANAILAGEPATRSTIFFVDEGKDTGSVLIQSHPVHIPDENRFQLEGVLDYAQRNGVRSIDELKKIAKHDEEARKYLEFLSTKAGEHQVRMKRLGDWPSYKFAVHHLIAQGRVAIDGRDVFVDGIKLPPHGFRLDEHQDEFARSGIVI